MKVVVTGASGLLGSRVMKVFPPDWVGMGTYHTHPVDGLVECNLEDSRAGEQLMAAGQYDWVIHCAANRDPESCEADPREAVALNADATEWLARAAADAGARTLYASTDYVFAGDDPPYSETDGPRPINAYGHSKQAGEERALSSPGALIVRMPALYSLDLSAPNNVLAELRRRLRAGRQVQADNHCVRYYTLAEDVARAFQFLIGLERSGVVHVSAPTRSTKFEFLRAAAVAMGYDPELVVEVEPKSATRRPVDSHLATGLYDSLGGPPFAGYRAALACLERP